MRLGVVCAALTVSLAACSSSSSAEPAYRADIDACSLLTANTLETVSERLPPQTSPAQVAQGSCRWEFGSAQDVVAAPFTEGARATGVPAHRYVILDTFRAEDIARAQSFIANQSNGQGGPVSSPGDFDEKYVSFAQNGNESAARLHARTKNLVVIIEYGGGNDSSLPAGIPGPDARDTVTRLGAEARNQLPPL